MSNGHEVDVVIIGAGLAGLSAGLQLEKENFSFVILEADHRPGGRVHSFQTEEKITVDLGAQWIEKDHYRMKKLLSQFGLKTVPTYKKGKTIYNLNNTQIIAKIPPVSVSGIVDFFQFSLRINKASKEIHTSEPWNSPKGIQFDKLTIEQYLQRYMYTKSGRNYSSYLLEEMLCTNLYEVSLLDLLWCLKTAGSIQKFRNSEQMWIKDGSGTLVNKIAEKLADNVYYSDPVTKIVYCRTGAHIYTENGVCWKAKRVIVAIPLNLQGNITYEPPLPQIRAHLLERAAMPSVIKVVLIYDQPFWRKKGLSGAIRSKYGCISETVDSSPHDGRRGVLTVLATGDFTSQTFSRDELFGQLVSYFGDEAGKPLEIFVENWSEQQWIRGGYGVHFAPGVLTSFGHALLQPIESLHWAGTETATEWRLFMEGAVQSGHRAANEVTSLIRKKSNEC